MRESAANSGLFAINREISVCVRLRGGTPVVATEKADANKSKHYKPKMFARQRDNCGYWNARGYAQRGLFFR